MNNRPTYRKMPDVPAKPLGQYIVVKRTVQKPTKEELEAEPKKDAKGRLLPPEPIILKESTEIHDIGSNNPQDLGFKVGDFVSILTYGTETITAEIMGETADISYALISPAQVIGVYK